MKYALAIAGLVFVYCWLRVRRTLVARQPEGGALRNGKVYRFVWPFSAVLDKPSDLELYSGLRSDDQNLPVSDSRVLVIGPAVVEPQTNGPVSGWK